MMPCDFCKMKPIEPRLFYESLNWYAFLVSPPYVKGHTGLVSKGNGSDCPIELSKANLLGLDEALAEVSGLLLQHFVPKDVLFASLRGREAHLHLHIIPLWPKDESRWRSTVEYKKGHLFEYLGYLECTRQRDHKLERAKRGWSVDEQREKYMPGLTPDIEALRLLASYKSA